MKQMKTKKNVQKNAAFFAILLLLPFFVMGLSGCKDDVDENVNADEVLDGVVVDLAKINNVLIEPMYLQGDYIGMKVHNLLGKPKEKSSGWEHICIVRKNTLPPYGWQSGDRVSFVTKSRIACVGYYQGDRIPTAYLCTIKVCQYVNLSE